MYLLNNSDNFLFVNIENFLDDNEIEEILSYSSTIKYQKGSTGQKEEKNTLDGHIIKPNIKPVRCSLIKWIQFNSKIEWLYKKISYKVNEINSNYFNFILNYLESFQLTEYDFAYKGFYKMHRDCFSPDDFFNIRKLSFSVQLSSSQQYEGGELIIYETNPENMNDKIPHKIKKEKGTISFFPSSALHEVTPVTKGIRYSLVGWCVGPHLK